MRCPGVVVPRAGIGSASFSRAKLGSVTSTTVRRAPAVLLAVLMGAMAIGPVFNYGLGALGAVIVTDYALSEGQYGLVLSLIYGSAALTATFLGVLADRLSPRLQIALIFGGVLVAFLVGGAWTSFAALLVAAVIAGAAQAFSNPTTNRIIAQRTTPAQRTAWMGWKQSGVQMGLLVAGLVFPSLGAALGWRGAALVGAAACVPATVAGWWVITRLDRDAARKVPTPGRPTPDAARSRAPGGATSGGTPAAATSGTREKMPPAVWLFSIIAFLNAVGTQGVNAYVSLFAVRALGFSLTSAGLALSAIGLMGIVSRIGWGRVAGRMAAPAVLLQLMTASGVVGLVCLIGAEVWHVSWLLWLGILVHAVFPTAANVVINSGTVATAPAARVGVASGLVATGMYLGFGVGPLVVGQLVDLTGNFSAGWGALVVAYAACCACVVALRRVQRRST